MESRSADIRAVRRGSRALPGIQFGCIGAAEQPCDECDMICAIRQRRDSPGEFSFDVDRRPLSGRVAEVEIDMVNLDFTETAKHDVAHRSTPGDDDAFTFPEVVAQLAPRGFEPLAGGM